VAIRSFLFNVEPPSTNACSAHMAEKKKVETHVSNQIILRPNALSRQLKIESFPQKFTVLGVVSPFYPFWRCFSEMNRYRMHFLNENQTQMGADSTSAIR
jgi:hypothetical protein